MCRYSHSGFKQKLLKFFYFIYEFLSKSLVRLPTCRFIVPRNKLIVLKTVSFSGHLLHFVLQILSYEFPEGKRFAFLSQQARDKISCPHCKGTVSLDCFLKTFGCDSSPLLKTATCFVLFSEHQQSFFTFLCFEL